MCLVAGAYSTTTLRRRTVRWSPTMTITCGREKAVAGHTETLKSSTRLHASGIREVTPRYRVIGLRGNPSRAKAFSTLATEYAGRVAPEADCAEFRLASQPLAIEASATMAAAERTVRAKERVLRMSATAGG